MGFKVILIGATESVVAKRLAELAEEHPWDLLFYAKDFTAESEASVESFFANTSPSVVISLLADPGDHSPISSLKHVSAVCAKHAIPIIHQSTYWAISPDDARSQVPESLLADEWIDGNEYALFESLVSRASKHVILRTSWVLDADSAGLFSNLMPLLLAEEPPRFVVSDHDFGAPITSAYVSDVIVALVQQILTGADNWGLYHLKSADSCSEAEFCDHLVRQLQKELKLELTFPNVAVQDDERRFMSMNANLVGRKITDDFGIQASTWRRSFGRTLRAWLKRHAKELGLSEIDKAGDGKV